MEKKTIIILSLVSAILTLIYIILSSYGYMRYITIFRTPTKKYIENYNKLDKAHDTRRVVISVITTDKSIKKITPVIKSLLDQTVKVDLITIVVPYGKDYDPPDDIKDCVTLFRTGKNYGDLNSLIPTIMREGDADTIIITVGDDTIYGIDFIEKLLNDKFKSSSDKNIIYNNSQEFIDIKKGAVFISDIFNDDFTNPPKDCDANKWVNNYLKNTPKERINYRENHKKM